MSLYNAIFGQNNLAGVILQLLNTSPEMIPRYRDAFVTPDGKFCIHTRTGGGNRPYYESQGIHDSNNPDDDYGGPFNEDLRLLVGYMYDRDDSYDSTYANFIYEPVKEVQEMVDQVVAEGRALDPQERWQELFRQLQSGADTPSTQKAKAVFEDIKTQLNNKPDGGIVEI